MTVSIMVRCTRECGYKVKAGCKCEMVVSMPDTFLPRDVDEINDAADDIKENFHCLFGDKIEDFCETTISEAGGPDMTFGAVNIIASKRILDREACAECAEDCPHKCIFLHNGPHFYLNERENCPFRLVKEHKWKYCWRGNKVGE